MCGVSGDSCIAGLNLVPSATRVKMDEPLTLVVRFGVQGRIREALNQKNWVEAYDRHDNLFRIKYTIGVQSGSLVKRDLFEPVSFVRKASLYWSRDPKLPPPPPEKKVWAIIVIDDNPILPESEEQARSLIFDVRRAIEVTGSSVGRGRQKLSAYARASWGRHVYTEPMEIEARSGEIEIVCC